jgi:hypothetical protein
MPDRRRRRVSLEDINAIERDFDRLEAKALLHGRTEAIEREITRLGAELEEIDIGAWEDWLMARNWELGGHRVPDLHSVIRLSIK